MNFSITFRPTRTDGEGQQSYRTESFAIHQGGGVCICCHAAAKQVPPSLQDRDPWTSAFAHVTTLILAFLYIEFDDMMTLLSSFPRLTELSIMQLDDVHGQVADAPELRLLANKLQTDTWRPLPPSTSIRAIC